MKLLPLPLLSNIYRWCVSSAANGVKSMEKELHEEKLFPPLKQYFNSLGYKVYCEVPSWSSCIDFVAVKGDEHIAVEMKMSLTGKVAMQAYYGKMRTGSAFVAVGTTPRVSGHGYKLCQQQGIGILSVKNGEVLLLKEATRENNKLTSKFRFDFTNWEEGEIAGRPVMKGEGPTYLVVENVKDYVRENPYADWKEIFSSVRHHYSTPQSLAGCMSRYQNFSLPNFKKSLAA